MRNILIPTDFSNNAADALAYALSLVDKNEAHFHIVHVINPELAPTDNPALLDRIMSFEAIASEESMNALKVLGDSILKKEGRDISISTEVLIGGLAASIKKEALEKNIDLIIMGTNGENHGALDKWIGTVSSSVIDEAPCPVVLVPLGYKFKPIDNIIFTTNLDYSDPFELSRAFNLIYAPSAIIRCLHVVKEIQSDQEKKIKEFSKYIIEHSPSTQTIFYIEPGKDIEEIIDVYANFYDTELIVMHKLKHSFLKSIFSKSHTKKMVFKTKAPLMILN